MAAVKNERIRVRAIAPGHYGDEYRPPGSIFVIAGPRFFSKKWMVAVGPDERPLVKQPERIKPVALSEIELQKAMDLIELKRAKARLGEEEVDDGMDDGPPLIGN
jgi:hypothetical protein